MNRQRAFLLTLTVVVGGLGAVMLAPFAEYLLTALILGFVLMPLQRRLEPRIGSGISAGLLIVFTLLAAILPFAIIAGAVSNDVANLINGLQGADLDFVGEAERLIMDYTGQSIDIESRLREGVRTIGSALVGNISGAIGLAADLFIGLSLMLFLQFYVLKDGRDFVEWTKDFDFMPDEMQDSLYERTSRTTWAVIKGHVLIAIVQGLVAGIGLWFTGIPNFVFWTFVMILLGFIPIVGTAFVWLPAAAYLFFIGRVNAALILLGFGAVIVGAVDNFLRPFLVDESADVHPFFIIAGVIGGVGLFGAAGLFIGPVIFGVLKALLNMIRMNYSEL